jgi:chromosome partitioning protein
VSDGEDLVSRARSIFARLRDDTEEPREDAEPSDNAEPSANGAAPEAVEGAPEQHGEPEQPPEVGDEWVPSEAQSEQPEQPEQEICVDVGAPPAAADDEPAESPEFEPVAEVIESPAPPREPVAEGLAEEAPALPERLVEPEVIREPVVPAAESEPTAATRPAGPRVIAVANQKGGVGKTTTAVNLGAALAELGYRVLVVDLDPQGNATTGLGINSRNVESSVYDVLMNGGPIEDAIEPTAVRNLFVVPATIDLAGAEIELVPAFSRELKLRRALEDATDDFDFTLIDCPPSLGLLTVNGLAAATEVLVPIQCEYYALEGLGQLLKNVSLVQTNLNPRLELSAIVLTMYDARTRLAEQVAREVRDHFGDTVCRTIVPRTVRLSEAPSFGQPVIVFDSSSRGALAYRELAKEVSGGTPQRTG